LAEDEEGKSRWSWPSRLIGAA